ncbi:PQQ-binding-like beta-propeller repeat protein [Halobium salinum]|uniref:PQQ-binding-like beta-propeller repeat protein n=1 Tax=Halobium salinum TaxID=1364940 RepID=A0ABD5PA95_9EURY|nr:PQQ-binding-like beta-propeller repeat protein [Halobium salinum]
MPSRRQYLAALGGFGVAGGAVVAGTDTTALDPEPIPEPPSGPAAWPQRGHDARNTYYNPGASPPRSTPEREWATEPGVGGTPVVTGDRVVAVGDDVLRAWAPDGTEAWSVDVETLGHRSPVAGGDTAYLLGGDLFAGYALTDGAETWRAENQRLVNTGTSTVAAGRLVLPYYGVSALDATGRVAWHTWYGDVKGHPAVDDGTVYVSAYPEVAALDLGSVAIEWPWEDRDEDWPPSIPKERSTRWEFTPPGWTLGDPAPTFSPALTDDLAVVGYHRDRAGTVRAFDRETGELRWSVDDVATTDTEADGGAETGGRLHAPPVVTDDAVLLAAADGTLRCLGHDGRRRWRTDLDGVPGFWARPAAGGDTVVVPTVEPREDGPEPSTVEAFDVDTGDRLWGLSFAASVRGLSVAESRLYATVPTDGGMPTRLVAFE